jgi:hypothetical protein
MENQFAQEQRWRDQQARLMEQDRQAERHERFYVPSDEEVAEELKRRGWRPPDAALCPLCGRTKEECEAQEYQQ